MTEKRKYKPLDLSPPRTQSDSSQTVETPTDNPPLQHSSLKTQPESSQSVKTQARNSQLDSSHPESSQPDDTQKSDKFNTVKSAPIKRLTNVPPGTQPVTPMPVKSNPPRPDTLTNKFAGLKPEQPLDQPESEIVQQVGGQRGPHGITTGGRMKFDTNIASKLGFKPDFDTMWQNVSELDAPLPPKNNPSSFDIFQFPDLNLKFHQHPEFVDMYYLAKRKFDRMKYTAVNLERDHRNVVWKDHQYEQGTARQKHVVDEVLKQWQHEKERRIQLENENMELCQRLQSKPEHSIQELVKDAERRERTNKQLVQEAIELFDRTRNLTEEFADSERAQKLHNAKVDAEIAQEHAEKCKEREDHYSKLVKQTLEIGEERARLGD